MKMQSILAVSFLFMGCAAPQIPSFPEIKDHWLVEVRDEEVPEALLMSIENLGDIPPMKTTQVVRCLKFEITSKIPYKIKFKQEEPMKSCHLVGGYKPKDSQSLYNWLDDAKVQFEKYKHCFKK